MKQRIQKWVGFFSRSLLWSLLLYGIMMLAINWDEISNTVSGKNRITIENSGPPSQNPIANNPGSARGSIISHKGIIRNVVKIVRTLTGFTAAASVQF